MTHLSEWLKAHLEEKGLTQSELARRAGVSTATMSATMANGRIPTAEKLFLIADALGVDRLEILSVAGLISPDDEPRPTSFPAPADWFTWQLVRAFHALPPEVRPQALEAVRSLTPGAGSLATEPDGSETGRDRGGYNCGFGSNIWNNSESDPAVLYDS